MRIQAFLAHVRWSALVTLSFAGLSWSQDALPSLPIPSDAKGLSPETPFGDVTPTSDSESEITDQPSAEAPNPIEDYLHGGATCETDCVIPEVKKERGHMTASLYGEYLLLRPRRTAMDYAIVDSTDDLTPQGFIESVDWETRSGFRFGGPVIGINGWSLDATYTYLHSSGTSSVAAPQGGTLFATASSSLAISEVDTALASANLDYDVLDVGVSRAVHEWSGGRTVVDVGGRIAWIDQKFQVAYEGDTSTGTFVSSPVRFDGVGLRVGGRTEWNLCSCLVGYARAGASMVAGTFDVGFSETDGGITVAAVGETYDQVVPVVDLAVGCQWQFRSMWLGVSYEVVNWFDMVDSPDFSSSFFTPGKLTRRTSDLNLSGLGVQLGWSY